MSLSHDSYTFGGSNNLHGALIMEPPDVPIQVQRIAGIRGETHLIDKPKGRIFACRCLLRGFDSWTLLAGLLDAIDEKAGTLTGTLTVTGTASATVQRATFIGRQNLGGPFLDGSGVHGWCQRIQLTWVQRSI